MNKSVTNTNTIKLILPVVNVDIKASSVCLYSRS